MTDVLSGEHISPRCIELTFDGPMRNDDNLRLAANYIVGAGIPAVTAVYVPTVQAAPYSLLDPNPNGGKPLSVYLLLDADPYPTANPIVVAVENIAPTSPVDYDPGNVVVVNSALVATVETKVTDYWEDDGLRVSQAFEKELPKLGTAVSFASGSVNRSMALAIAKLADMVSGGSTSILDAAIVGPLDTIDSLIPDTFVGGFGEPDPIEPGIGDTITFRDGRIPWHIDKLWGVCDGVNTLFRTSIPYHPFACIIIEVPPQKYDHMGGDLEFTEWYAPNAGRERLLRVTTAPMDGYSLIAVYIPRQSIVRIDDEIIAYHESDITAGTGIITGRSQLCTPLEEHTAGTVVEDVWCTSFVNRVRYSLLAFGASGKALEYVANDQGLSRTDNPSFSDTELRRAVFNTAVTPRATFATAKLAFRYIYPDLWPYVFVTEDVRWPKCLVVWYSSERINDDIDVEPLIEPWETWLDHIAYSDGFPLDTYYHTYFRNPIGDVTYDGDYFLANPSADDEDWPYPIIVSGPDIYLVGVPAPFLPNPDPVMLDATLTPVTPTPVTTDYKYKKYMRRPYGLDRVLPVGTGVLLLDIAWAS